MIRYPNPANPTPDQHKLTGQPLIASLDELPTAKGLREWLSQNKTEVGDLWTWYLLWGACGALFTNTCFITTPNSGEQPTSVTKPTVYAIGWADALFVMLKRQDSSLSAPMMGMMLAAKNATFAPPPFRF